MLKNKFKIIALLAVIILALTIPIVRAENENADNAATPVTTSEDTSTEATEQDATEVDNFKKSDVYLAGDDVTIDYIVDGNLFVVANNVTINSQIGGDAFICANTVTVGEQGYVFSNLFTFSKNVNVKGVVYDLYACSQNTTITGYVYRDVRVGSNTVNIFGTVGRNAFVDCVDLNFTQEAQADEENQTTITSQGMVGGNLNYTAKEEASISEGAVSGEITFEKSTSFDGNTILDYILSLATLIVTTIVIWLLCLWLKPKFINDATSLLTTKKVLPVIGLGILTPIAIIVVSIILLMLGITSTIGLLLLAAFFILVSISTSLFIVMVNNIVCAKLKIEKPLIVLGILVACTAVLWLVCLIPYLGAVVKLAAKVLGLGVIVSSLVLKEKNADSKKEVKKVEKDETK